MLDSEKILKSIPLFANLAAADLHWVAQRVRPMHVPGATVLFRKGDPGHGMIAVQRGKILVSNRSVEGVELIIAIVRPGEVLGEFALLDEHPRSADAVAMEPCDLLVLNRTDMLPLFARSPIACLQMLRILVQRLRRTTERMEEFAFLQLPSRMARDVLWLAETAGRPVAGGIRIDLALSQQQIASLVGAARESVNRHLKRWEQEGYIVFDKGWLVIRDADALRQIAGTGIEPPPDLDALHNVVVRSL